MKNNSIATLDSLLEEITPEEQMRTDAKMQLAAKIADAMIEKGWNNNMLMLWLKLKYPVCMRLRILTPLSRVPANCHSRKGLYPS